jgi:membrane-associated phospholipid phosphatase
VLAAQRMGDRPLAFQVLERTRGRISGDQKKPWNRIAIWSIAVVLVLAIGYSRIYSGVHYPSDVLAGYLGALVWVLGVGIGDRKAR